MFSIDATFLIVFLSFLVFLVIMQRLFFAPMMSIKAQREAVVQSGQQATEDATQKGNQLTAEYNQHLAQVRQQAHQLLHEKRQEAQNKATEVLTQARHVASVDFEQQAARLESSEEEVYHALKAEQDHLVKMILEKVTERQKSTAMMS